MIRSLRIVFGLVLVFVAAAPALAVPPDLDVKLGTSRVKAVIDGDTLLLDDTREVRLVGLQAPKLPLGRKNVKTWPLAAEAKTALAHLVLGRQVSLHAGGAQRDRHGRVLAHLMRDDGLWVQAAMLRAGMARVYSFPDNRAAVPALLAEEGKARADRRGIWGHAYYAVRTPETVGHRIGTYELVEGRVLGVTKVKARTYMNFGPDYRTDFTITLNAAGRRALTKASLKPEVFEGSVIRVRGWVSFQNGPMIAVSHPEQIEIVDPTPELRAILKKPGKSVKKETSSSKSKRRNGEKE